MDISRMRRCSAGLLALAGAVLLTGCFFAPGRFASTLDIRREGTFAFRYEGELYLLPLMEAARNAQFKPQPCTAETAGELEIGEAHPCSAAELAAQRKAWAERQAAEKRNNAKAAQYLFGGIDPADPRAGPEFAARIRRQAGWSKVDYAGGGKFDVVFEASGRLDHDFAFPTIEQLPMANALVQLSRRQDGSVRVDAPGFGPSGPTGLAGMMQGMATGGDDAPGGSDAPSPADGRFTLTTDGTILANNTDEGAKPAGAQASSLSWTIDTSTQAAPMALVRLVAR